MREGYKYKAIFLITFIGSLCLVNAHQHRQSHMHGYNQVLNSLKMITTEQDWGRTKSVRNPAGLSSSIFDKCKIPENGHTCFQLFDEYTKAVDDEAAILDEALLRDELSAFLDNNMIPHRDNQIFCREDTGMQTCRLGIWRGSFISSYEAVVSLLDRDNKTLSLRVGAQYPTWHLEHPLHCTDFVSRILEDCAQKHDTFVSTDSTE